MSSPYWGKLPGPKVVKNRQRPHDDATAADPRHSLDPQPPRKPNRASVQTTNTESTFSPAFDSPTASTFSARGLAPRPPSFQRRDPAIGQPTDDLDQRVHRLNHGADDYDREDPEGPASPPAAPEVPRGPPLSYRHPYGNGGLPYTYSTGSAQPARQAGQPVPSDEMDAEEYYRSRGEPAHSGSYAPALDSGATRGDRGPVLQEVAAQSRAPAGATADRRKKFANDRSPLQRLELTLDSMTKEEKRARVMAAEQRARERATRNVSGGPPANQEVRPRERQPSLSRQGVPPAELAPAAPVLREQPVPRELPVQRKPSARRAPPSSQQPEDEQSTYASGALHTPATAPTRPNVESQSGIPKRNLSFRERAVRDDVMVPGVEETAPAPPQQSGGGGLSLTRNGSNKLRKEPPGDPWYHTRTDAERRLPSIRGPPVAMMAQEQHVPRPVREKELPPDPPRSDPRRPQFADESRGANLPPPGDNIQGIRRHATEPIHAQEYESDEADIRPPARGKIMFEDEHRRAPPQEVAAARRRLERQDSDDDSDSSHHHRISGRLFKAQQSMAAGNGLYNPPEWLDEWKKSTVGTLSGALLDVDVDHIDTLDKNKAWWEKGGRRGSGSAPRARKAEAFDGEYDETNAPTRFKPPLYLKCGPLLRYCGVRQEKAPNRTQRNGAIADKEIWRGSVMIVTNDAESSYEIAPTLRLFVQDMELLPPPPHRVNGELSPEYVDPIAGHPKLGRRGETLYVRPVEHLEEAKDLSQDETDTGLFETTRSPPDVAPADGSADFPGSFSSRRKRIETDGEKLQKYKDVRGFRLHVERGYTFWRFNIEVELRERQQRIAYRINRGPSLGFWVPARGRMMNIMFHSCNGFSASVNPNDLSGPDPLWRDVLNTHQSQPFHVMLGGGDQIYNDSVSSQCALFEDWTEIRNPLHKHNAPFTLDMQDEMEEFYFERYSKWFSQGLFGLANSQIPMVNMYDDHDIFDGYGSYPHHDMNSPVFSGLGAVAFKYYMLFQHQSIIPETEKSEPSWITGINPGPYIRELSHSLFMSMGGKTSLLAVDTRTERTEHDVIEDKTWEKIMNRLYAEVRRGQVEHLLVLLGVPIAYPRLVWLENILTSRLMNPVKALGKTGVFGKVLNNVDNGVEVLDDLNDHWTAKNHKHERSIVIEDLQDLAIDKSLRITILSGDVHLAAAGQFYSNPKLGLAKHKDPRYMPNIISSAIVNTPPPVLMADVLNKRNKVHHFDKQTDEDMIPMFSQGVDGKPRNNKRLLPHRNWCSIRQWTPGTTPPPTPPQSRSPSPPPGAGGGILRRLSLSKNRAPGNPPNASRDSVRGPRPPLSGGGGLFRSLSRRLSTDRERPPAKLVRTQSLGRGDTQSRGFFGFGRSNSRRQPDDGGINGQWGAESEDDDEYYDAPEPARHRPSGIRGGAAHDEYSEGDESYFTAQTPRRAQTVGSRPAPPVAAAEEEEPPRRPFHRTPTGLSTKQMRKAEQFEVDLEGGLDVCLNVEVNPKDPTGITVPYRLLVPRLYYEYTPGDDELPQAEPSGFKRLLSFRKKEQPSYTSGLGAESHDDGEEDDEYYQGR